LLVHVIFVFSARDNVTLMILVTHQFRPFTVQILNKYLNNLY